MDRPEIAHPASLPPRPLRLDATEPIDVLVSARRDAVAARRFFRRAIATLKVTPTEVVTDAAAVYPAVLDELLPRGVAPRRTACEQRDRG